MKDTISIPVELLQQVVNYLTTQPWAQVNEMIVSIQKAAEQKTPKEESDNGMEAAGRAIAERR